MGVVKQAYSATVRSIARSGVLDPVFSAGEHAGAGSWRHWAASLGAIHDIERMIALDIPWWNVAAAQQVDRFLAGRAEARVFEYGSGASTVWLARRSREVVSVEHDAGWLAIVAPLAERCGNATVLKRDLPGTGYTQAIAEIGGQFDLIVVDGRRRMDCLAAALAHRAPGGIIVVDDTGRSRYRAGIAASGLKADRHFGRSYCVPYPDFTTILHD